jgi:large subunit ribosomal protein L25
MELNATKRTILGKKSKNLRREGKIPGVIFGKSEESVPVSLTLIEFEKVFRKAGETTLVDVKLDGKDFGKILIKEVDVDPVKDFVIHANLQKVNLKEKIKAQVPVKIVGESPIVKSGEGLLLTLIDEVEVECLPSDIPHAIEVDITSLTELDQAISVADLNIDKAKVEIIGREPDELVVKIDYAEMKEEAVAEPTTEAELVAKVAATEQLTEEQKAAKAAAKKDEKKD